MNRTAMVLGLILVGVAAVAAVGFAVVKPAAKPPNVMIVLWDTTRADRLTFYGYDRDTTPRMSKWATEHGVVFENAISPDMWTVPSHASLFTGLPPGTHGAGFDHRWLDNDRVTMAEWFGDHGYDTYAFSANPNLSPNRVNLLQGFKTVETSWGRDWRNFVVAHTKDKLIRRDKSTEISPGARGRHSTGFYNAAPITHEALTQWLDTREDRDKPFFAYLSYMEAHKPRVPTLESRRRVADEQVIAVGLDTDITFKSQLLYGYGKKSYTPEELFAINRVYDAALADLDGATADLLDDLEARGILDDTIVVFTADHGEQLGEHQQFGHRSGVYQSLLHVPLVIAYPRKLAPKRIQTPVSNLQVFDTILELAGLEAPETGITKGNLTAMTETVSNVFSETLSIDRLGFSKVRKLYPDLTRDVWANTYRAVVQGNWKLIQTVNFDTHEVLNCELYDLDADPAEATDKFGEQPAKVAELAQALESWKKAQVPWDPAKADTFEEDLSDAEKRQLEMLGYLSEEDEDEEEGVGTAAPPVDTTPLAGNRCRVAAAP